MGSSSSSVSAITFSMSSSKVRFFFSLAADFLSLPPALRLLRLA